MDKIQFCQLLQNITAITAAEYLLNILTVFIEAIIVRIMTS